MERQRKEKEAATVHTMEALVTKFLRFKVNQTVTGMKSAGRAINLVTYMKPFKAFVGPEKPVSSITEMTLFDYHSKSIQLLNAGEISDFGARDRMQVAKQFIRWAWELGLLELPRNINSKELTIYVEQKEIRIFDFAKLKSLVDGAPEPLKVYLLLMANCGMTAMDVGDLQHSEFNAKDGTITRVRSKRKKRKGGSAGAEGSKLKISWKLWPVTIELIKKLRSNHKQFMFTGHDGNPGRFGVGEIDTGKSASRDRMTTAQIEAELKQYLGQRVRWDGTVLEVKDEMVAISVAPTIHQQMMSGNYEAAANRLLAAEQGKLGQDEIQVVLKLHEPQEALSLTKGQKIRYSGVLRMIGDPYPYVLDAAKVE